MKTLLYSIIAALSSPVVLADVGEYGHMMDFTGTGMMGSGLFGLYWLVWFALAAFVFSVIFWLTHNWLVKKRK